MNPLCQCVQRETLAQPMILDNRKHKISSNLFNYISKKMFTLFFLIELRSQSFQNKQTWTVRFKLKYLIKVKASFLLAFLKLSEYDSKLITPTVKSFLTGQHRKFKFLLSVTAEAADMLRDSILASLCHTQLISYSYKQETASTFN